MQVAKITYELAQQILGQLSNDGVRYFNPREDALGNWVMDMGMAQSNGLEYEVFIFDAEYFNEVERVSNPDSPDIIK